MTSKINNISEKIQNQLEIFRRQFNEQIIQNRLEFSQEFKNVRDQLTKNIHTKLDNHNEIQMINLTRFKETQNHNLDTIKQKILFLEQSQKERLEQIRSELKKTIIGTIIKLDELRTTIENNLKEIQINNQNNLEQIKITVNEKLQDTLNSRISNSFIQVSNQLEKVHQSVGEMQTLAIGIGDLKRILTNVKSKGIWSEIQLGSLLEQVLAPAQYIKNAEISPGSGQRVEFAIKFPSSEGEEEILLPIDAKFPHEDYDRLVKATELANQVDIETASKAIESFIKTAAKEIHDKYINPPYSTDFALMFLPTEGLYAEVIKRHKLAEILQRDYRVIIAGPSTLYALLNSLQIGFRSLAIKKRGSEVWQILAAIKTEFEKYEEILEKVRKRLQIAEREMTEIFKRKRNIDRKLRDIEKLPEEKTLEILNLTDSNIISQPPNIE